MSRKVQIFLRGLNASEEGIKRIEAIFQKSPKAKIEIVPEPESVTEESAEPTYFAVSGVIFKFKDGKIFRQNEKWEEIPATPISVL